jgi:hypothetical protein
MRVPILLGLTLIGLAIWQFRTITPDALPGAIEIEQVLPGVEGIVKGYLKSNRVVVFSKVITFINFILASALTPPSVWKFMEVFSVLLHI